MPNPNLELWRKCIKKYHDEHETQYKIPKKGTKEYDEIKKMYDLYKSKAK